jgi:hypothetical protein
MECPFVEEIRKLKSDLLEKMIECMKACRQDEDEPDRIGTLFNKHNDFKG